MNLHTYLLTREGNGMTPAVDVSGALAAFLCADPFSILFLLVESLTSPWM